MRKSMLRLAVNCPKSHSSLAEHKPRASEGNAIFLCITVFPASQGFLLSSAEDLLPNTAAEANSELWIPRMLAAIHILWVGTLLTWWVKYFHSYIQSTNSHWASTTYEALFQAQGYDTEQNKSLPPESLHLGVVVGVCDKIPEDDAKFMEDKGNRECRGRRCPLIKSMEAS